MLASNFLSEKAEKHLVRIDLSEQVQDIHNIYENMQEDLPNYLIRFGTNFSSLLTQTHNLGVMCSTPCFNTKSTNIKLRKAFLDFVEKNRYTLSRELTCAISPVNGDVFKVNRSNAFFLSISLRKLIHKAWLESKWYGDQPYDSLEEWLEEASFEKKKVKVVQGKKDDKIFCQKGSNLFRFNDKLKEDISANFISSGLFFPQREKHTLLEVLAVAEGKLIINEDSIPGFNLDNPMGLYIVAQSSDGNKHIAFFSDLLSLALSSKLRVRKWSMYTLCNVYGTFQYVLEGRSSKDEIVAQCYGRVPFIHPQIIR